jgi:hypothetical protein
VHWGRESDVVGAAVVVEGLFGHTADGRWTAVVILMRRVGRLDMFLYNDSRAAANRARSLSRRPTRRPLLPRSDRSKDALPLCLLLPASNPSVSSANRQSSVPASKTNRVHDSSVGREATNRY